MSIELEILFKLEKMFGKVLTLEQGLEVMGRVVTTQEVLDEEGTEYDFDALIYDTADFLLNEK
jgi:hypothetical protein